MKKRYTVCNSLLDDNGPSRRQCRKGAVTNGLNLEKKLIVNLSAIQHDNKKYIIAVALCNSKKCKAVLRSSIEFNFEELNTNIIESSLLKVGCILFESGASYNQLRFSLYEKTAFYKSNLLLGRNYVLIGDLDQKTMLIPLTADSMTIIKANFK